MPDNTHVEKNKTKIYANTNLEIEVQRMWHLRGEMLPIFIGACEIIRKENPNYFKAIPRRYSKNHSNSNK